MNPNECPKPCAELIATETRCEMLDRVFREHFDAQEKALELQAAEYARRLDELNHAHQQSLQDRTAFVTRDRFDTWAKEIDAWRARVNNELAETRGKALGWSVSMGVGVVVLTLVIQVALRWAGKVLP